MCGCLQLWAFVCSDVGPIGGGLRVSGETGPNDQADATCACGNAAAGRNDQADAPPVDQRSLAAKMIIDAMTRLLRALARRRTYGMSWTADEDVARQFAQRTARDVIGGSVLLRCVAPANAIVSAVAINDGRYCEREYVVDRRHLGWVEVLERFKIDIDRMRAAASAWRMATIAAIISTASCFRLRPSNRSTNARASARSCGAAG